MRYRSVADDTLTISLDGDETGDAYTLKEANLPPEAGLPRMSILLMRSVQVRGRFPQVVKDETSYGEKRMKLSQIHKEMVLAIPYFKEEDGLYKMVCSFVRGGTRRKGNTLYNSKPAQVKNGIISPRRDFKKFFDGAGIQIMTHPE